MELKAPTPMRNWTPPLDVADTAYFAHRQLNLFLLLCLCRVCFVVSFTSSSVLLFLGDRLTLARGLATRTALPDLLPPLVVRLKRCFWFYYVSL